MKVDGLPEGQGLGLGRRMIWPEPQARAIWKLTATRVFYWLMIHNFVFFVQIFAAGTIT